MNWETGIDMSRLFILHIKQVTDENLPYSTGNSSQCVWLPKWKGNPKGRGGLYM